MTQLRPSDIARRPLFVPLILLISLLLVRDLFFRDSSSNYSFSDRKASYTAEIEKLDNQLAQQKGKITAVVLSGNGAPIPDPPQKILLTVATNEPLGFNRGDVIEFFAALKKPHRYANPGVFDYARYLSRQGLVATAFIDDASQVKLVSRGEVSILDRVVTRLRNKVLYLVADEQPGPEATLSPQGRGGRMNESTGVLIALLWGDESGLSQNVEELFRDQGLSHLLVISGLHFSVIAFLVYQLILSIGRLIPSLLLYFPYRKIAAALTLVVLLFYFLLCEKNPSVIRATIAVSCYLVAMVIGRARDFWNILFFAAFLILLAQPEDLFSLSFQFSFVAVLCLLVIFPRLKALIPIPSSSSGIPGRAGRWLLDLILVNLSIFFGLTPLLVFYFHEIQWNGILMNLWAVPAIELVVVPIGLVGLLMASIVPTLASFLLSADLYLIDQILSFLRFLSATLPHPSLAFPPRPWELTVYYSLLFFLCFSVSKRLRVGVLVVGLTVLVADGGFIAWKLTRGNDFQVTHLDVGQGDAILVELPGPKRILIDGGGSRFFDFGERVLIPFLLHQRIPSLDAVCATHSDIDHYGGLVGLLEKYRVRELWWNGIEAEKGEYGRLFRVAEERGIPLRTIRAGEKIQWDDGVIIDVLSPSPTELEEAADNAHSIVLKIGAKGHSALFTADIEADVESRLVAEYGTLLDVDYLKVPHHGSRHSSSLPFLKLVSPEVATVGAKRSRFGHPHPEIVRRYESLGVPLLQTEILGAVVLDLHHIASPLGERVGVRGRTD